MWTGLIWPMIRGIGLLLWTGQWTFRFHKRREIICLGERLSASEDTVVPCSSYGVVEQCFMPLNRISFVSFWQSTKMAYAVDRTPVSRPKYWHRYTMQLISSTPSSDNSCTSEKELPHIAVKNASHTLHNRINRSTCPRWVRPHWRFRSTISLR
jgi:hypothetical protein